MHQINARGAVVLFRAKLAVQICKKYKKTITRNHNLDEKPKPKIYVTKLLKTTT